MYEEWFEKIAKKLEIIKVKQKILMVKNYLWMPMISQNILSLIIRIDV